MDGVWSSSLVRMEVLEKFVVELHKQCWDRLATRTSLENMKRLEYLKKLKIKEVWACWGQRISLNIYLMIDIWTELVNNQNFVTDKEQLWPGPQKGWNIFHYSTLALNNIKFTVQCTVKIRWTVIQHLMHSIMTVTFLLLLTDYSGSGNAKQGLMNSVLYLFKQLSVFSVCRGPRWLRHTPVWGVPLWCMWQTWPWWCSLWSSYWESPKFWFWPPQTELGLSRGGHSW